ncbi:hypothetical protein OU994_04675 [Pseudoduganella sp. SL102]|uniref:Uncharacterized protein n=1 Tax=Pseudoduganella albidiflava TaxID=321983 RepID=A0AA88C6A6_9BURK|nr:MULTISPECIES: hypothetical protein [Pseudoduganella]WBS03606.1 hypothetical protein OU994_04675 [Pseudoduganella sp. SL102]GGY69465.1 hypothetical protein GCM10007387_59340 [Pseudoduganella albidiflava]
MSNTAHAAASTATAAEHNSIEHEQALQAHFQPHVSVDEIEQVFHLKRAQPLLQVFTALFHGGFESVLVRLLVLRELANDATSSAFSRADINTRLAYLLPESLETVLMRLRTNGLLAWDAQQGVYRVTPMARNVLSSIDALLTLGQDHDEAEMGFLLSQVAGAQAVGGVTSEQLQHLLGRLTDLTDEFRDAIASGSEFRLRESQAKWHTACDWVEKGSEILRAITSDENADAATHRAAQAIGRAQSSLLNMQGMFSRALNQIERQRVHLGQSGLSTTDIKRWLLAHQDLASLAEDAIEQPVKPLFITPAEMIDVAETELMAERVAVVASGLPSGEDAPLTVNEDQDMQRELDDWLARLSDFATLNNFPSIADESPKDINVHEALLPASFAVASYRASMLPLLGDEGEASLQGATAALARLPLQFAPTDMMVQLDDMEVAAMTLARLSLDVNDGDKAAS